MPQEASACEPGQKSPLLPLFGLPSQSQSQASARELQLFPQSFPQLLPQPQLQHKSSNKIIQQFICLPIWNILLYDIRVALCCCLSFYRNRHFSCFSSQCPDLLCTRFRRMHRKVRSSPYSASIFRYFSKTCAVYSCMA